MDILKHIRSFLIALVATIMFAQVSAVQAGELVMFEQQYCEWCETWHAEIGQIYPKTDEGKLLPLRLVDIDKKRPEDLKKFGHVRFTPTFIVVEDGQEIGRILGYPGEANFYWLLNEIIGKLDKPGKKQALLAD